MQRRVIPRRAVLALAGPVALAACSGTKAAPEPSPAAVLAAAKAKLDKTPAVTIALTSTNVPPKANGVSAASGTGLISSTAPSFKGSVTATVNGLTGNVPVISIGEDAWIKLFTPEFTKADLSTLGAPNPSHLFDSTSGISSLLAQTKNPTRGDQVRQGQEILQTYTGTLPSAPVTSLLLLGKGAPDFAVAYGIADSGELRTATLTGQFYTGKTSTYRLVVKDYGKTIAITRP